MKEFNSIQDMITDEVFVKNVKGFIQDVEQHIRLRPGGNYKRQWFDRLIDIDGLNSNFFINNFLAISVKRSNLSSELRNIISSACEMAIHKTLTHYSKENNVKPKSK
jgi:hypothetical protein